VGLFDWLVVGVLPVVPKPVVGFFSRRYIAGESTEAAIDAGRDLNSAGCMVTLDVLGEAVRRREEALEARDAYLQLLPAIAEGGVDGNVSLKPTQLGLTFDPEFAYENITAIVARAKELGNFVRIDMEDSPTTDATLEIYRRLRGEYDNVGVVLQSCLRRTLADARALGELKANVRLCKGIYIEPYRISWRDKEIISRNFVHVLEVLLRAGCYVGIATHDEVLVFESMNLVHGLGLGPEDYEFQMLLGVTERLREVVIAGGHRMRVYVPFGRQWYAYSTRRLKENPSMASAIAKDILGLSADRKRR
jgi:proline dehydrogenase